MIVRAADTLARKHNFVEQSNKNGMRENKAKRLHIISLFVVVAADAVAHTAAVATTTNEYKQIIRRNNG